MHQQIKEKLKTGVYALAIDNHAWLHPEYAFSAAIKGYQYVVIKSPYWRYNHAALVIDGTVYEMLGGGLTITPIDEWLTKRTRTVAVFDVLVPLVEVENLPYGFYDVPQITLNWIRKARGKGNTWNGVDGVPKKRAGWLCIEYLSARMSRERGHVDMPCQMFEFPELKLIGVIETKKL